MRFLAKFSLLSLLLLLNILLGILTILLLPRSSTLSLVSTEISSTSSSAKLLLVITSTSTLLGRLARVAQPDSARWVTGCDVLLVTLHWWDRDRSLLVTLYCDNTVSRARSRAISIITPDTGRVLLLDCGRNWNWNIQAWYDDIIINNNKHTKHSTQ